MICSRYIACAVAMSAGACGSDGGQRDDVVRYVGTVSNTDARIAVIRDHAGTLAYVCGGPDSMASHTRWLMAATGGNAVALEADGWRLELRLAGDALSGALRDPAGASVKVMATHPRDAAGGLYGATTSDCRTGVIVYDGADGPAVQGVWCDGSGAIAQVDPIPPPKELTGAGFAVTAQPIAPEQLQVLPVLPADLLR